MNEKDAFCTVCKHHDTHQNFFPYTSDSDDELDIYVGPPICPKCGSGEMGWVGRFLMGLSNSPYLNGMSDNEV